MMGYRVRRFQTIRELFLEQIVPQNNFYRLVEEAVDFSSVRDLVQHLYADLGRQLIDPAASFNIPLNFEVNSSKYIGNQLR